MASNCLNFQTYINGKCIDNRDATPMGWAVQLSVPLFIIPTSILLLIGFLSIVVLYVNLHRAKGKNIIRPFKNFVFHAAVIHSVTRVAAIIAQAISIARLQGVSGSNAFLIPWALSKMDTIGTAFIALHFLTFNFLKRNDIHITNRGYSWTVKSIIALAIGVAVLYFAYIIAITNLFRSKNAKATSWGWHIMAVGYGLDGLVALTMLGVIKYVRDRQIPSLYVTHSAKILSLWIGTTIYICMFQIVNIYWFELSRSAPSAHLDVNTQSLMMKTQIPTQRSLSLRTNQNYLDHFQLFMNFLILSWKSMEIIPGSEFYYLLNSEEWLARAKLYYPDNPGSLGTEMEQDMSHSNDTSSLNLAQNKGNSSSPRSGRHQRTDYSRTSTSPKTTPKKSPQTTSQKSSPEDV